MLANQFLFLDCILLLWNNKLSNSNVRQLQQWHLQKLKRSNYFQNLTQNNNNIFLSTSSLLSPSSPRWSHNFLWREFPQTNWSCISKPSSKLIKRESSQHRERALLTLKQLINLLRVSYIKYIIPRIVLTIMLRMVLNQDHYKICGWG